MEEPITYDAARGNCALERFADMLERSEDPRAHRVNECLCRLFEEIVTGYEEWDPRSLAREITPETVERAIDDLRRYARLRHEAGGDVGRRIGFLVEMVDAGVRNEREVENAGG